MPPSRIGSRRGASRLDICLKWRILLYVVTVYILNGLFLWRFPPHIPKALGLLIQTWIPGIISLFFRLFFREGFGDAGWKLGHWRFWLWASVGPLVFSSFTYFCAYLTGSISVVYLFAQPLYNDLMFTLHWPDWSTDSVIIGLLLRLCAVGTIGLVENFIYALGEELGWRGYLQTRLVQSGWRFPLVLCGIIWSVWHFPYPFVLWIGYRRGLPGFLLFSAAITLAGVFVGWLRLASGSVWIAAMMHASHNAFYGALYGVLFYGSREWLWAGEAGIFSIIAYGIVALWLYRSGRIKQARNSLLPTETDALG